MSNSKNIAIFVPTFRYGPIVKWIEWRIPVPLIRVRIAVGSLISLYITDIQVF